MAFYFHLEQPNSIQPKFITLKLKNYLIKNLHFIMVYSIIIEVHVFKHIKQYNLLKIPKTFTKNLMVFLFQFFLILLT